MAGVENPSLFTGQRTRAFHVKCQTTWGHFVRPIQMVFEQRGAVWPDFRLATEGGDRSCAAIRGRSTLTIIYRTIEDPIAQGGKPWHYDWEMKRQILRQKRRKGPLIFTNGWAMDGAFYSRTPKTLPRCAPQNWAPWRGLCRSSSSEM